MEKKEMQPSILSQCMTGFGIPNTDGKEYEAQGRSSGFAIHLSLFSTTKLFLPQLISARISKMTSLHCCYYFIRPWYHEQERNYDNEPIIFIQYSNQKDYHSLPFLMIIPEHSGFIPSSIARMQSLPLTFYFFFYFLLPKLKKKKKWKSAAF